MVRANGHTVGNESSGTAGALPAAVRECDYYLSHIRQVETVEALMGDARLYDFVMTAHGLEDMAYARSFIRRLLVGGLDGPGALAIRFSDSRYSALLAAFNFALHGTSTTSRRAALEGVVTRYLRRAEEKASRARLVPPSALRAIRPHHRIRLGGR
ncbi:Protein of unknown function [Rhizobium sp. RU20A]|uniref:DUF1217 domain-containing protein n=1 Tax=Rhizobium sp. RU20A TaxID=1907412 RepID=UPI0009563983|nr:DUF1217 domain-containing protein [Rhizobium sp. RU20A]SIQ56227.1 Protein of unknown function [Rhizobium sp. RU20A]